MSSSWWEALNQALGQPAAQIVVSAILIPALAYFLNRWWKRHHPPPPHESHTSISWNLNFTYIDARNSVVLNPEGDPFHTPLGFPPGITPPAPELVGQLRMGNWVPGQTLGSTRPLLYFDGRVASLFRAPTEPSPSSAPFEEPRRVSQDSHSKEKALR